VHRVQVVVIDDDASIVGFVRTLLEVEGYDVYEALNGHIGLATVEAMSPAVVVLDALLPDVDGMDVCRRITADHPDVAVLVLSGSADPAMEDRALAAGAARYVAKPVDAEVLAAAVGDLVARRRAR
jgi:DNA-binding response OmpR family regulator